MRPFNVADSDETKEKQIRNL